jgi:menaquinone-dependent protoporphyrinogen oxidase
MSNILIIYSTTDGQTRKICHRLQQVIEPLGHQVTAVSIQEEPQINVAVFDKIVIGASIRYGKHSPLIINFIEKNRLLLESKPCSAPGTLDTR